MFKPDRPIEGTKDDLLGRAEFSRSFGQAILAYNEKDCIVTALYGDWGSGKSSAINMTLEYIEEQAKEKEKDEKPIVVKFNPWNYSDQSHLIALFFKELSFALRREDYGKEASDIGEKLEAYSNFFTPLALIPDPTVITVSVLMQRLFGGVGKAAKAWGAAYSKDLDATRKELNKLLGEQKRKIVIVVDDIDRLNNYEIRQIFQLVKMLGDFPNTIYVLAFDRDVVVKALAKVQEGPGDSYLEKIVQFPIELPPISKLELEKLLFKLLDGLIKDIPEEKWDGTYWGNIYHSALKDYFKTIRDVTRYINALKFSFEMVREDVNPVDFIAMTAIQVFEPVLYSGIRDNKDIFMGVSSFDASNGEKKQATARFEEILTRSQSKNKEQLVDLISRLFPKLDNNMGYGSDWMKTWRRESRICHPELFDIYFMLALPPGEIPKSEIMSVLDLAEDREAFSAALIRLMDDGKIIRYLELMEDYTSEYIKEENIQNNVSALMDYGDLFPERKGGTFDFDTPIRILRILRKLSLRFGTQEARFKLIKQAIEDTVHSIYTIVHKVGVLGQEHGKLTNMKEGQLKPVDEREVNAEQLDALEALTVQRIQDWAESGKLDSHPNLPSILYSWERWGKQNKNVSKEFANKIITTDKGLIDFITAFVSTSTSHTMGDNVSRNNLRISLKNLSDFVEVDEIEPRIRKLKVTKEFNGLNDKNKKAIEVFLNTFDGKVDDW